MRFASAPNEALGSDAIADGMGDTDATHASGTAVMEASNSLKQIFAEGPNLSAIEQSGQDQGRVHWTLYPFREALINKEFFQGSESSCSRFDALVNVGIKTPPTHGSNSVSKQAPYLLLLI